MNSMYGEYRGIKFTDAFKSAEAFIKGYKESGFDLVLKDNSLKTTYNLLYANYGNSTFASSDINRAIMKTFSLVFQYGPYWERKLELQSEIRQLTLDEAREGTRQITSRADNPSTKIPVDSEFEYTDSQGIVRYKKSKVDAYEKLEYLLSRDPSKEYITKFKVLFLNVVEPNEYLLYDTDVEEK